MTWWLYQSTRLRSEKAAFVELEGSVDWLNVGLWQANSNLEMSVDFNITLLGKEFPFEMIYPSVFPDVPPMVYTKDRTQISKHQYGSEGELCLEYRPDNWRPIIKGADMIESCYRLLSEERKNVDTVVHARSAHVPSLGRDLRSNLFRFLLTVADFEALNRVEEFKPITLVLNERVVGGAYISSIHYLGDKKDPFWFSNLAVPKKMFELTGHIVRLPGRMVNKDITISELKSLLEETSLHELLPKITDQDETTYLLVGDDETWVLFWLQNKGEESKITPYTTVSVPTDEQRVPDEFHALKEKNVGIVGCGSVGSKIAASLCRSGVGTFLLIDEDIFFPGNVVRNELSLQQTGAHKSFALRERLLELNPKCDVKSLRLSLGGQESSASIAGVLEALGSCDLLVDATADPIAFNLIGSVASRQNKPMVWVEVFAGGIGGLVVRARPDVDPTPNSARAQIDAWCREQSVDWVRSEDTDPYVGESEGGQPLVADDSEVTLIASHGSRFATDILVRPNSSIFPYSAYVIGFSSEWLFAEPFDTRPIILQPEGQWGEVIDPLEPEDILNLLKEHITPKEDGDATPTSG